MKRRIAGILAAVAMLATGAATMGCFIILFDEPRALNNMID